MSDEQVEAQLVDVRITAKAVHRAVQNILKNEMAIDVVAIKQEVHQKAFNLVKREVIDYIEKHGYGHLDLKDWAGRAMKFEMDKLQKDFKDIVKQVVRELVTEHIREQVIDVVGGIIKDGIEVSIGWNKKVKVKVKEV